MTEIKLPELDATMFDENLQGVKQVAHERQAMYFLDDRVFPGGVEYPEEGGILVHKVGGDLVKGEDGEAQLINPVPLLYPEKGYPSPERVIANNMTKRYLMGWITFISSPVVLLAGIGFLLLPWKFKIRVIERWMQGFKGFAQIVQRPHYFKNRKHYNLVSQEICHFLSEFLTRLGFSPIAHRFAFDVAHLIEYDTAYRLFIEDIAAVVTKEQLLEDPRKSIRIMVDAFTVRHPKRHIVEKFMAFEKILLLALLLPKVRRAFRGAMEATNWKRIQLDEIDTYHVLRYSNYNFMGIPHHARLATYFALHNGNPPKSVTVGSQ